MAVSNTLHTLKCPQEGEHPTHSSSLFGLPPVESVLRPVGERYPLTKCDFSIKGVFQAGYEVLEEKVGTAFKGLFSHSDEDSHNQIASSSTQESPVASSQDPCKSSAGCVQVQQLLDEECNYSMLELRVNGIVASIKLFPKPHEVEICKLRYLEINHILNSLPSDYIAIFIQEVIDKTLFMDDAVGILQRLNARAEGDVEVFIKFSPLEDDLIHFVLASVSGNQEDAASIPFRMMKKITDEEVILKKLIVNTLSYFSDPYVFKPRIKNEITTSCSYTARLVSCLFYGASKSINIEGLFFKKFKFTLSIPFLSGESISITFDAIVHGLLITHLRAKFPGQFFFDNVLIEYELNKNIIPHFLDTFNRHYNNFYENQKGHESEMQILRRVLDTFPYNEKNLENLTNELKENASKTNEERSYVYYICLKNFLKKVDHTFVIEQFQRKNDHKTCYRIYQSWIGMGTLAEDLKKNQYDESGDHSLNEEELITKLTELKKYFTSEGPERYVDLGKIFGYPLDVTVYLPASGLSQEGVFSRCDLLYWCEPVKPKDFNKNYIELATKPYIHSQ